MAALTAVVGYGLAPRPEMAATQVISQTAYAAMLLAVASRKRLIGWAGISWTLLRPSGLRHLLSQR